MPDTLDEYFEYDAEEFLVSLALLITEGRTPECSVKGRSESFHCPPAQSCYPVTTKHECSDKLAQVRIVCWLLFFFYLLYKLYRFCHHLCYTVITMPTFKYKIGHSWSEEILILGHSQQPWLLNKLWEALGSFADQQAGGWPHFRPAFSHTRFNIIFAADSASFILESQPWLINFYVLIYLVDWR